MEVNSTPRIVMTPVGNIHFTNGKQTINVKIIEPQFPRFKAPCTSPSSELTFTNTILIIDAISPTPAITIGKRIGAMFPKLSPAEMISRPKTIVARMVATYEPNKSAPIPATSPTLSPTLSAIVAGFRGSSSGIPASTFPTKSAPTSAAFV